MTQESTYLFCQRYMDEDETVLWRGRPEKTGLFMNKHELLVFYFSVGWIILTVVLFAFIWIAGNVEPGEPILIGFTIAFPLAGVFMAVVPLRRSLHNRNSTEYVITNKRIFRRVGIDVQEFREGISDGYTTEIHHNGNGTLTFPTVEEPNIIITVRYNKAEAIQNFALRNIRDYQGAQKALTAMNIRDFNPNGI